MRENTVAGLLHATGEMRHNHAPSCSRGSSMRIHCAVLAVCLAVVLAAPAQAAVIDLSTMKCKEFMESSKDDIGIILTWLDAYYREDDDPPVIDTEKFVENAKKLAASCAANPTVGLITTADKLFSK
jgi:acid stress chaperone HdeB